MTRPNDIMTLLLLAALLLAACSGSDGGYDEDSGSAAKQSEIRLTTDADYWVAGTRATMIEGGELTSGSFTAAAYVANSTTSYINPVQVDRSGSQWLWSDGKHYWPAEGNLDFFAYKPATKPSYITTGPTYSVSGTPQATFTCANMPMSYHKDSLTARQGSDLQEFVWGITVGQNKTGQGTTGVTMKFRRPFARIRFQLSASHPDVQINSITFKNLKTGGTCTLNNTAIEDTYYYKTCVWSALTPATGGSDLTMTLASKDASGNWITAPVNTFNSNPAQVVPIGGYEDDSDPATNDHKYVDLLVIPQDFAGAIEVNASWNDWGDTPVPHTVSKTLSSITWRPGYTYTYTFTISTDDLTVNVQDYTEQW